MNVAFPRRIQPDRALYQMRYNASRVHCNVPA